MSSKFCTNCGRKLNPEEKFCSECGQKLVENEQNIHLEEPAQQKRLAYSKFFNKKTAIIGSLILLLGIFYTIFIDSPRNSQVKGVSDKVYYQLVEQYFYLETQMDMFTNDGSGDIFEWMEAQKQFKDAEKYAENSDRVQHAYQVFPNPLFYEYHENQDSYSSKEIEMINKVSAMFRSINFFNYEKYEEQSKELEKDLRIKDSYYPFEK
ncbi:hypothetical protein HNQ94_002172 [Salirhabdus euzebyi]|uniref:Zinc-ribbon domain-containing protein n=1 Tax=Salirhabdus euzebyi TaxID=394506 RepID=A0A841Q5T8_9BACI|nr:zinc ribbon domain-containing protein [Salirhabdus euzebyi]MBB6453723.1 hypothetical protein [Salirhabdus euzebyi]